MQKCPVRWNLKTIGFGIGSSSVWGGRWFSEDDLNMNGFRGRLGVEDMVKYVKS